MKYIKYIAIKNNIWQKKIYISLFLNFPLSSFFLIIENLEPNLLFVELFEFLPLKKPEVFLLRYFFYEQLLF